MYNEQSSISIINKNNGQITGEGLSALPIKLVDGNMKQVRIKYFLFGFFAAIFLFILFISIAKRQVVVVDVSGKAADYKEYQIN